MSDKTSDLFRRARSHIAPPPQARARVLAAVRTRVTPVPSSFTVPRVLLSLVVAGAVAYVAWPDRHVAPLTPISSSAPIAATLPSATTDLPIAPVAPPTPTVVPTASSPPRVHASSTPAPVVDDFTLLTSAKLALQRHDPVTALTYLDQHTHDFSNTPLAEERLRLRIEALCAAGRVDEAKASFASLQSSSPHSPHIASLVRACPILANNDE
jgi:hypothetical protein